MASREKVPYVLRCCHIKRMTGADSLDLKKKFFFEKSVSYYAATRTSPSFGMTMIQDIIGTFLRDAAQ